MSPPISWRPHSPLGSPLSESLSLMPRPPLGGAGVLYPQPETTMLDPENPENYECENCGHISDLTEVDYCDACNSPLIEGDRL